MVQGSAVGLSPLDGLEAAIAAMTGLDPAKLVAMCHPRALFEIPMLKPSRLYGRDEIGRGMTAAFADVRNMRFCIERSGVTGNVAIGSGTLSVARRSAADEQHEIGIVAEIEDAMLARLSLYLNARHRRLWSDPAIL